MKITALDVDVEIIYVDEKMWTGGCTGDFQEQQLVIRIVNGLKEQAFMLSLVHELCHFKQYLFGKTKYDEEEEANHDALFWCSVLNSNKPLSAESLRYKLD